MALRDVVAMIRGERGTTVELTVLRKKERFEVAIVRDKVMIEDAAATSRSTKSKSTARSGVSR